MLFPFQPTDLFSDTTFILNTTLPTEPTTAVVQRQTYGEMSLEEMQALAEKFGFSGTLYMDAFGPMDESMPDGAFGIPVTHYAFDGSRQLSMQQSGFDYTDTAVTVNYQHAVPNALEIAETFLQERGLLNFPYTLGEGFAPSEVQVYRMVNGRSSNLADYYIQIGENGQVAYVSSYQYKTEQEDLGEYPLITAEAAWNLIQSGVLTNNIPYSVMPQNDVHFDEPFMPEGTSRYWLREFVPGEEAHLYTSAMVYLPVGDDPTPRIQINEYLLNGDSKDLQAIAEKPGDFIHLWGQINADGIHFDPAGWEWMPLQSEYVMVSGQIGRDGRDTIVVGNNGDTYILPNAPDELESGLAVFVYGPNSRDTGQAYPVLDWETIEEDKPFEGDGAIEPVPMPIEPLPEDWTDPYQFDEIVINEVVLVYYYTPDIEPLEETAVALYQTPPALFQPAWHFIGETNNGDMIEFFVQAASQ